MSVYFDSKVEAQSMLETVRSLDLKNIGVSLLARHEKDWSTRWKRGWKPFSLTRRFHVIPLWQKSRKCPKGKKPIYLDTTNAFGTGLHETTKFTAQLIDRMAGQFNSFLDVGTGSGILTVVAYKLGVKRIDAFDIDPAAVDVARANLRANGFPGKRVVVADISAYATRRPYGLVAANLVTQDLIAFKERLLRCVAPGGHLIVSGISLGNLPLFQKEFAGPSLSFVRTIKGREWVAVLIKVKDGEPF